MQHSLGVMAGPVTMAALTTAGAGACLLPTRVLAYTQIGSFLLVLMLVSWLLSTLPLQSLLSCWGPAPASGCSGGKKGIPHLGVGHCTVLYCTVLYCTLPGCGPLWRHLQRGGWSQTAIHNTPFGL